MAENMGSKDFAQQTALMNGTPALLGTLAGSGARTNTSTTGTAFTLTPGEVIELQGGDSPSWVAFGTTAALASTAATADACIYLDVREKSRPYVVGAGITAMARLPVSGTPVVVVQRLS